MNHDPNFRIVANSQDVTDRIRRQLKNISVTDESGITADTLEIELADSEPERPIPIPETGAELEVFLGYGESLRRMGLFVVDEIEVSGPPSKMILRARAAPHDESKTGMIGLQTQRTRSFKAGITIGALVERIAGEHRMRPAVAPALASIALPHTDQVSESDLNLLHRIAKRYDAVAKPAGGAIVFAARGESVSASGGPMPRVSLALKDVSSWRVTLASRETAGTVVAYYRDTRKAERREVKVGEGEPVKRLRMAYPSKQSAESAAKSELRKAARAARTLELSLPGDPRIVAESLLSLSGFREGVSGDWVVTRAVHYFGPDAGFSTRVDAELPNASPEASRANVAAEDAIQAATLIEA